MRGLNHKGRTNSPFTEVVTGVLAVVRAHLSCSLPPLTGLRRFTSLCNTTASKAYHTTSLLSTPAPTCKTEVWSNSAHSYQILERIMKAWRSHKVRHFGIPIFIKCSFHYGHDTRWHQLILLKGDATVCHLVDLKEQEVTETHPNR